MFEFLKSKSFYHLFSFLIGIFIVIVFKTPCNGEDCIEHRNVDINEMTSSIYQLGSKCYKFSTNNI